MCDFFQMQKVRKYRKNRMILPNIQKGEKMVFFARIFGICKTKPPADALSWRFSDGKIEIESERIPEIALPGQGVRLEGKGLNHGILLFHGDDGKFYAVTNQCTHMGRRLDPVAHTETIQCCSISKSTYDYTGKVISGAAKDPLKMLPVEIKEDKLIIWLHSE
jgi:nitrite reductase/ring-hydroxylating ferredoxin subunit